MSDLKISIVIPSYNQGQFIEDTIASIIGQSHKNFEIIIIDGGSTDNTVEVIRQYEHAVKYWISERDSGQSDAINKGLKIASGDIVTWLNSDDYYEPGALQKVASWFSADPHLALLHGKSVFFGKNTKKQVIGLEQDIPMHEYLPYMRFPQPSSFIRKKSWDEAGGNVNNDLHYAMDFELVVKLVLLAGKIKRVDDVLAHYRMHASSKSNDDAKFMCEWAFVVYSLFHSLPGGKPFADSLVQLKLAEAKTPLIYPCRVEYSKQQLEEILIQHIDLQYHYYYRNFYSADCFRLSDYIKANYPQRFVENNYRKYNFRLRFIPKFVFKLLRRS